MHDGEAATAGGGTRIHRAHHGYSSMDRFAAHGWFPTRDCKSIMNLPILTVGHSSRTLADFLLLLEENSIDLLVDVRRLPGSNRYPHFNADVLESALLERGIEYTRPEGLTGRRAVSKDIAFEVNAWWQNRSFHNYADHALSREFRQALAQVTEAAAARHAVVMCSEAVWWRCHRRIIADYLIANGTEVRHILGESHVTEAELSAGAKVGPGLEVTYPASA